VLLLVAFLALLIAMTPQAREVGKRRIRGRQRSVAESAIHRSGSTRCSALSVDLGSGICRLLHDWQKGGAYMTLKKEVKALLANYIL
jgi:hypothetical protein